MNNLYDDPKFFEEYKTIREGEMSYNNLIEQPFILPLLPSLHGKSILDLGCGLGINCNEFINRGANRVLGIDISNKMLEEAKKHKKSDKIEYMQLDMNKLFTIDESFDLIFSSLAIHYIEDFNKLVKSVYDLLKPNGIFLFSQEHPLVTSSFEECRWLPAGSEDKVAWAIHKYSIEGERHAKWIVDDVLKYHRSFSTIVNTLIENGFAIEKVVEPTVSEEILRKSPRLKSELHRPTFLIIKAKKDK